MKFGNLLKKELGELITKQAILMLVFVVIIYVLMGSIMGKAMSEEDSDDTAVDGSITLCCQDNSEFTQSMLAGLEKDGTKINYIELQSDDYAAELERLDMKKLLIIPQGFGDNIVNEASVGNLKLIRKLSMGGFSSTMSSVSDAEAANIITTAAGDEMLLRKYNVTGEDIDKIKSQVATVEYTAYNGATAEVAASNLQGILIAQSMIAPFVIFFLLIMASSMIMTAISTEKIDKTLETLLSTPVSRMTVLMAKMLAALISALLNAAVMMIGFAFYILGMVGGMTDIASDIAVSGETADAIASVGISTAQAMSELGLTLSLGSYVLFGIQLFLTVAIGLSLSLILGAMATDAKSVQTLTLPIMLMVLIPFFMTMFLDINSASLPVKIFVYLIPFTHTFTGLTNLLGGHTLFVCVGIVYQIIFFMVCMFIAVKMFTTDKLFTVGAVGDGAKKKSGLFGKRSAVSK